VEAPAVVAEVEADADAPSAVSEKSHLFFEAVPQNIKPTQDGKSAAQIYADKIKNVSAIASPLASRKLTKKVLKAVKKGIAAPYWFFQVLKIAAAAKSKHLKRGVKEVVKAVRKGEKGYRVLYSFLLCC